MAKWVCVKEGYNLTVNKVYDGYIVDPNLGNHAGVRVINNEGKNASYYKHMFMPLDEWREQQIKTILDE